MTGPDVSADADRIDTAKRRLLDLLDDQLAVVKPEAIARLGETYNRGDTRNIDPHITGRALRDLELTGKIITTQLEPTRGGASVATIQPADQHKRATAIRLAAGRKRLLYARYLGWASGTRRSPHGLIGPSGETAVRRAIIDSAALQPAAPGAGPVSQILNVRLNGAADSGGFMSPLVGGIPQAPVTVLIEVKSIREWIYPAASELFQVLHKCLLLKHAHPAVPVVPILVCRRAQETAFYMAKQLGFIIIEIGAQFLGDTVPEEQLLQVRNELGFTDLYRGTGPSLRVRDRLRDHLGPYLTQFADTWTRTAQDVVISAALSRLRNRIPGAERAELLNDVRNANRTNGNRGGW